MVDWLTDLRREVLGAGLYDDGRVGVTVGSLTQFVAAVEQIVSLKAEANNVVAFKFCGIDVVENPILPSNVAVVLQGGKILNIIKFSTDG